MFFYFQFWCGEWPICQLQPVGPPVLPRFWSGAAHQLPGTQPAPRVLPLSFWQRLRVVPQVHVTKLLHCLWTVSSKNTPEAHRVINTCYRAALLKWLASSLTSCLTVTMTGFIWLNVHSSDQRFLFVSNFKNIKKAQIWKNI